MQIPTSAEIAPLISPLFMGNIPLVKTAVKQNLTCEGRGRQVPGGALCLRNGMACMALEQARHEGSVSELSVLERQGGWVPLDEQVGQRIGHG